MSKTEEFTSLGIYYLILRVDSAALMRLSEA